MSCHTVLSVSWDIGDGPAHLLTHFYFVCSSPEPFAHGELL